jgi:molybdopterin/thiamine biosynthesis adenylyltransferase/proteasome lid subunit RPN8/RPN11
LTSATLVLTDAIAADLAALASRSVEHAAVLIVGVHAAPAELRLLARELHEVGDEYCDRHADEMTVSSAGWVHALGRAEALGAAAVWVHSHPAGDPTPSRRDATVDGHLAGPFSVRSGSPTFASLVVAPSDSATAFTFTGRVQRAERGFPITRCLVVGSRMRVEASYDSPPETSQTSLYDRQVRAFGGELQRTLGTLRVGLAGCGGTGSAVAEQLARLGVRNLIAIDPDVLSESNTTRVYGSDLTKIGQPKVQVLADHVQMIAPVARVTAIIGKVTEEAIARQLADCDVVFGCTDDEAGRMVLSRLASYQLVPVIDCGVLIDSDGGTVKGIHARVTVMHPGAACLLCRGRVDPALAAAELAPRDEHTRLVREGYAPELPGVEPAVVAYTTLAAALAVGELLERLVGYGPSPAPSELLARLHEREMSTNSQPCRPGHYCDPAAGLIGAGDTAPFLGQAWAG